MSRSVSLGRGSCAVFACTSCVQGAFSWPTTERVFDGFYCTGVGK